MQRRPAIFNSREGGLFYWFSLFFLFFTVKREVTVVFKARDAVHHICHHLTVKGAERFGGTAA